MPTLGYSFVEYDDQHYVTDNPRVQAGLSWKSLTWAFGYHVSNWHPLTWISHMLDSQLFGAWAGGHHLTNVLLHTASTLLLFAVLRRMTKAELRSAMVAAVFAWHPLHVESVAWIAERKDVLCGFFWMLTLWFYVRFTERSSVKFYSLALCAFGLSLMAKPMAVTLPFALLLLDAWPLGRLRFTDWKWRAAKPVLLEKLPFFVLAIGASVLTVAAQDRAIVTTNELSAEQRLLHALNAYSHYFWANLWPFNLAIFYPYQLDASASSAAFSFLTFGIITLLAWKNWKPRPYLLMGWLWFVGTLVPVIGLLQVGDQAWADRYMYLPQIGLTISFVWFGAELLKSLRGRIVVSIVVCLIMAVMTSFQLRHWKNTKALFEHANEVTSNNYLAVSILGSLLAREGKLDAAIENYQTALRYKPGFPEAHFFLGNALDEQGHLDAAVAEYKLALQSKLSKSQTHAFIAIALAKQGKYDEAAEHYKQAIRLDPDSAVAQNNLARLLHTQGKLDDAISHYQAALEINPNLALAHNNLGVLLLQRGDPTNGLVELDRAFQLNPTNAETAFNLAFALNQRHQWAAATNIFAKAMRLNSPATPKVFCELGIALSHSKQTRAALAQFAQALLIQPDYPDALDGLAWLIAVDPDPSLRDGTEAVKMASRACELTEFKDALKIKTLAAAYAEAGQFESAQKNIELALRLTKATELIQLCEQMSACFRSQKPWRAVD